MSNANPNKEPSMNEILASIRQIIEGGGERPGTGPASQRRQAASPAPSRAVAGPGPASTAGAGAAMPVRANVDRPTNTPVGKGDAVEATMLQDSPAETTKSSRSFDTSLPENPEKEADTDLQPDAALERGAAEAESLSASPFKTPMMGPDEAAAAIAKLRAASAAAAASPGVTNAPAQPKSDEDEPQLMGPVAFSAVRSTDHAEAAPISPPADDDAEDISPADGGKTAAADIVGSGPDMPGTDARPAVGNVVALRDFSFDFDEEGFAAELLGETGLDLADDEPDASGRDAGVLGGEGNQAARGSQASWPALERPKGKADVAPSFAEGGAMPAFGTSAHKMASASEHAPAKPFSEIGDIGSLISREAGAQVAASFDSLAQAIRDNQMKSMEQVTREMLRPMLQEWLDDNLPRLVEKLVREEIERVARGGRR